MLKKIKTLVDDNDITNDDVTTIGVNCVNVVERYMRENNFSLNNTYNFDNDFEQKNLLIETITKICTMSKSKCLAKA